MESSRKLSIDSRRRKKSESNKPALKEVSRNFANEVPSGYVGALPNVKTFETPPERHSEKVAPASGMRVYCSSEGKTLANIVGAIVAYGAHYLQDHDATVDHSYVARYLFHYIRECWDGDSSYFLTGRGTQMLFPPVIWDIIDAGRARACNDISFMPKCDDEAMFDFKWTIPYTGNCSLGSMTSNKGYGVEADAITYSAITGREQTHEFFKRLSSILGCVTREEYTSIEADDPSAFAMVTRHDGTFGSWTSQASFQYVYGTVYSLVPIRCQWLARLGLFSFSNDINGEHTLSVFSSPAAIVVDRMIRKLKGYQLHERSPVIKTFDASDLIMTKAKLLWAAMLKKGDTTADNVFIDNLISFDEFKLTCYRLICRHFYEWSAVGAGYSAAGYETDNHYTLNVGTMMTEGALCTVAHEIKLIEEGLNGLRPVDVSPHLVLYPLPIFATNWVAANMPWTFYAAPIGFSLEAAWNWISGTISGGSATQFVTPGMTKFDFAINVRWNSVVAELQSYLPFIPYCDEKPEIISTRFTRVFLSLHEHPRRVTSSFPFDLWAVKRLEKAILCDVRFDTLPSGVYNLFQSVVKETYSCSYPTSQSVSQTAVGDGNYYFMLWIPAVHSLAGQGDPFASFEESRARTTAVKDYIRQHLLTSGEKKKVQEENGGNPSSSCSTECGDNG